VSDPRTATTCTYSIVFSTEDGEYVATSTEFPSLSWLDPDPCEALRGLLSLIADVEADISGPEHHHTSWDDVKASRSIRDGNRSTGGSNGSPEVRSDG
jgi:hypothetical protein